MQGPLREDLTRISTRSSVQGLYRIMQGHLREEVSRISARAGLRENLQWKCRRLKVSEPAPQTWTQSRQTWTHVARAILCENSEGKCRAQDRDNSFCVSLRNGHGHGHVRRVILCNNWHGKSRQTVGAPWSSTGLYSYRKNPSVWTRCLGKKTLFSVSVEAPFSKHPSRHRHGQAPPVGMVLHQRGRSASGRNKRPNRRTWHLGKHRDFMGNLNGIYGNHRRLYWDVTR